MSGNTNWTAPPWTVWQFVPEDGVYPTRLPEADRLYGCYEIEEACDDIRGLTDDGEVEEAYRVAEANRNLIRAAHAMREALEKLVGWSTLARLIDKGLADSIDNDPAWTEARAALALARGEAGDE